MQRLAALIVLATVAIASVASDFALYRCQLDGNARASCCCEDNKSAPHQTTIKPACCDVELVLMVHAAAETARTRAGRDVAMPVVFISTAATSLASQPVRPIGFIALFTPAGPPPLQRTGILLI